jgi:hypothetical protein
MYIHMNDHMNVHERKYKKIRFRRLINGLPTLNLTIKLALFLIHSVWCVRTAEGILSHWRTQLSKFRCMSVCWCSLCFFVSFFCFFFFSRSRERFSQSSLRFVCFFVFCFVNTLFLLFVFLCFFWFSTLTTRDFVNCSLLLVVVVAYLLLLSLFRSLFILFFSSLFFVFLFFFLFISSWELSSHLPSFSFSFSYLIFSLLYASNYAILLTNLNSPTNHPASQLPPHHHTTILSVYTWHFLPVHYVLILSHNNFYVKSMN